MVVVVVVVCMCVCVCVCARARVSGCVVVGRRVCFSVSNESACQIKHAALAVYYV